MSPEGPFRLADAALAATWPAAQTETLGPLTLRRSAGGGSRVTAATLTGSTPPGPDLLDRAEHIMRDWGQPPRFRISGDQARFDAMLAARGYAAHDPTLFYSTPAAALAVDPPRLATFDIWPPLAIQIDIWNEAGIGPDRIAVMHRAAAPRTALFGRANDQPAATAFLATHDGTAMIHALEVRPAHRRCGVARHMMAHAALWALRNDCHTLALAVTEANVGARALYDGLGMTVTGRYHYRKGAVDARHASHRTEPAAS